MYHTLFHHNRPLRTGVLIAGLSMLVASTTLLADEVDSDQLAAEETILFPSLNLPAPVQGEEAIQLLGASLNEVARYYGRSALEFTGMLRADNNLWLDRNGRAFFLDRYTGDSKANPVQTLQAAPFPLKDTFTLNSRPGANRVIYLDFSGNVTSNSSLNSLYDMDQIKSSAYSQDDKVSFSRDELRNIQLMWQEIAEDFSPFDVNVTTQFPGESKMNRRFEADQTYGTRVIITSDNFAACDCDGISYLGAFDDTGSTYKPVFVFTRGYALAGGAISHQLGHSLGLLHDGIEGGSSHYDGQGNGPTGWAPVMGMGYQQSLVQWSMGEYRGASNKEDDFAAIQVSGLSLLPDDHADSTDKATRLAAAIEPDASSRLSGAGLIEQADDADVFSFFSGAGSFSIEVSPATHSSNLDILVELYDASGALVAKANPANSLAAVLAGRLGAGQYYLRIDGAGKGDPLVDGYSDYGSFGRYTVGGIVPHPGKLGAPEALALADYDTGLAPRPVDFDGTGYTRDAGDIVSWHWDFGDGNSASGAMASHIYQTPGIYTATLTVTDSQGHSGTDSVVIAVDEQREQVAQKMPGQAREAKLAAAQPPW